MKRRIAVLVAPKKFEIIEEELRPLQPNEVLIKVVSIGLCHSDMPTYLGQSAMGANAYGHNARIEAKFPAIVGHEPVGIVEEIGSEVKSLKVGDYVGGTPRLPGFTDYLISPADALVVISKDVPREDLKYCLAEPLMCVSNIVQVANPRFGDYVAVVGCGMMGLLTISGLRHSGAKKIIALDVQDSRLELAKKYGATDTINPATADLVAEIDRLTNRAGADVVVEITGSLRGLKTAVMVVRYANMFGYAARGRILIPSLYGRAETWDPDIGYELMYRSPILYSTHPPYTEDYMKTAAAGIDGFLNGMLPLKDMITHEFSLDDVQKGFEYLESGADNYIKGIIVP